MSKFHTDSFIRSWALSDPSAEPSTLRGISRVLQQMVNKPEGILAEDRERLVRAAEGFLPQVEHAIGDTLRLLESTPEQSPMNRLYAESLDAFRQTHHSVSLLMELKAGCPKGLAASREALERVEGAEEILAENLQNWRIWKGLDSPRCGRCGYESDSPDQDRDTCPDCDVDLLLPDGRFSGCSFLGNQAILGPEYVVAFRAYLRLQDGEATLRQLDESLVPLKNMVAKWQKLRQAGALRTLQPDLQEALVSAIQDSQCGLAKLAEAQVTRDWIDINDGWELLYRAGVLMQSKLPHLYRSLGESEAADDLESVFRTRDLSTAYN